MISYTDLIYFVELTQTLNFSRAAERVGISQPSLSTAIKRLENWLGTPLFMRNKHKVLLTVAGKNLQSHAKQLLQLWETTKATCLASEHEVQGSVTLGCHSAVAFYLLHKFLPAILKKYTRLEIKLKHDLSRKIAEEIINYTVDIGIIVNPIRHPDLIIKKLFNDEICCWHEKSFACADENEATFICDPDLHQTQWVLKKLTALGFKDKRRRIITTNNLEVIANLTAAGVGIGIVPARVILSLHPNTVIKLAQTPIYRDEICLVYRHENRNLSAVQVLCKEIKNHAL